MKFQIRHFSPRLSIFAITAFFSTSLLFPSQADGCVKFSGQGRRVTRRFDLPAGFYKIVAHHSGESNFIIEILDKGGVLQDILANEIGPGLISQSFRLEKDDRYVLNIRADGRWGIALGEMDEERCFPKRQPNRGIRQHDYDMIRKGMTDAEVLQRLGEPDRVVKFDGGWCQYQYIRKGSTRSMKTCIFKFHYGKLVQKERVW
jgi:hypothetical protein